LQEKEFQRLGGSSPERVDVRFIAATHCDLDAMVARGEFREDLFYRLNVIPIWLPPLRERRLDIASLTSSFCERSARENARVAVIGTDALTLLERQAWPGNVRELQSFVERLVVFSDGNVITASDVNREFDRAARPNAASPPSSSLQTTRATAERDAVEEALSRAKGNRSLAARLLGVSRRTLYNKLAQLGLGHLKAVDDT